MSETKIPSARLDTTEFTFTELAVGNGTAALPSYSFSGDQNTGIYTSGSDTLNFSTGGVARASIDSTSLYITMPLLAPNGSAATPAMAFNSDTDSGWFGLADNSMRLSLGGIQRFIFDAGALYSPDGSAAAPSYTFVGDTNTGMFRSAANVLDFSSNGVTSLEVTSGQVYLGMSGTAALPALSFIGDSNTGIYRPGVDQILLTAGGAAKFGVDSAGGLIATAGYLQNDNGSAVAPSYSFYSDPDTGIFRVSEDRLSLGTGGVERVVQTNGFTTIKTGQFTVQDGTAGAPTYTFENDLNTGLYRITSDRIGLSLGGTVRYTFADTSLQLTGATHSYLILDRSANTNESLVLFSTASSTSAAVGLDNDGTERLAFFTNGDLGTPKVTIDSGGTTTFVEAIREKDGSAAAPSYNFTSDTDTGIYRRLSDSIGITTGGSLRFDFNSTVTRSHVPVEIINTSSDATLLLDSQSTGRASQISFRNSTPVTHRIGIETDTDSGGGAFLGNANSLNFEVSGSNRIYFSNQSTARFFLDGGTLQSNTPGQMEIGSVANYWGRVLLADGSASVPSYTFGNDADTGIYRFGANELSVALGGAERFRLTTSNNANDIRMMVWDHTANALVQVTRGAADSGGAGFRVLRVPN